jgi:hypothetical protein
MPLADSGARSGSSVQRAAARRVRVLGITLLGLLAGASPLLPQAPPADTMPVAVVQRFVDGANARDLALMMAVVAPEAVFARLPHGQPLAIGRDSIQALYRRVLATLPATSRVTVESRMSDGNFVVDREHFTDPGPQRRDHATWIYHVTGGLIRRAWVLR